MFKNDEPSKSRPPSPVGWRWARLATICAVIGLAGAGALAVTATLAKLSDKSFEALVSLATWSLLFSLICFVVLTTAKWAEFKERRSSLDCEWQRIVESLLRQLGPTDILPRLSEIEDPVLGPTRTRYTNSGIAPYVSRPAVDGRLQSLLKNASRPYPFIVLYGHSKAGKSRALVEAARAVYPNSPIIIPRDGAALAELTRLRPEIPVASEPSIVWLDDLDVSSLESLSSVVLDECSCRAIVLGTMTAHRYYEVLRSTGPLGGTARAALSRAIRIEVPFECDDNEIREARRLYPSEKIEISIAESLVGGEELLAKLAAGMTINPAGQAIVRGAIDCDRVGLRHRPTTSDLRHLFPLYLSLTRPDLEATDETFTAGLKWASEPVASQVALLTHIADEDSWEVLDYIVAAESGLQGHTARRIPRGAWSALLEVSDNYDALNMGIVAIFAEEYEAAVAAFRIAVDHQDTRAMAGIGLGVLLADRQEHDEAQLLLRQTAEIDDPVVSLAAMYLLGNLAADRGDMAQARKLFDQCIRSDHGFAGPLARCSMASMLAESGDREAAEKEYAKALNCPLPEAVQTAAIGLGRLADEAGDLDLACSYYRQAIEVGHLEGVAEAAFRLGRVLEVQGNGPDADVIYKIAVDAQQRQFSPQALLRRAELAGDSGDIELAKSLLRDVFRFKNDQQAQVAATRLGMLLGDEGDNDGAIEAYREALAIDSGLGGPAAMAALNLGNILYERGDLVHARAAYERILNLDETADLEWVNDNVVPNATLGLAIVLDDMGEVDDALRFYQMAADSTDVEVSARAAHRLGEHFSENSEFAAARQLYARVLARSGTADEELTTGAGGAEGAAYSVWESMNRLNLGVLLAGQRDFASARRLFEEVVRFGGPLVAPVAMTTLGDLLAEMGLLDEARSAFEEAISSNHEIAAPIACAALGDLLVQCGRGKLARRYYERALKAGKPVTAAKAAIGLGGIFRAKGKFQSATVLYKQAVELGDEEQVAEALLRLGETLSASGELDAAQRTFKALKGTSEHAAIASLMLARLLLAQGRIDEAQHEYAQAANSDHGFVAPLAQDELADLVSARSDPEKIRSLIRSADQRKS